MQAEIEALENELGDAHKEIARLNMLANQSPARRAIDKAKDARIEALEKEKDDLWERLQSAKGQRRLSGTPIKYGNTSAMSPMHRQILAMSLKSPKTKMNGISESTPLDVDDELHTTREIQPRSH